MQAVQPPSVSSGSEGFRFRLIGTTQWRAGEHPIPSVSIETYGDFEKVWGVNKLSARQQWAGTHLDQCELELSLNITGLPITRFYPFLPEGE